MKKTALILVGLILLSFSQLTAQQHTAAEFWKMEHDTVYTLLLQRQNAGETLSTEELTTLTEYRIKLTSYFESLSDNEKSLYYQNRAKWSAQPGTANRPSIQQETDVYAGERSMYTRYLVSSGIFGLFYGTAAAVILGVEEGGTAAIPLLTAGASVLIPMLSIKDKNVTYNSLALANHGKLIGALQGAAFGFVLTGDNIDEGKLILGLSTASSIGLGRLGYSLGKNRPWSQGRAALYSHYGFFMPLEGLAVVAAFESENPRIYGLTSLVFGAGGYLIADHVAQRNDFSRGDVTAITTLTTLNAALGIFIAVDLADDSDVKPSILMIPALGAFGGTLIGQAWLKNAKLTIQQGRNVALASAGGSLIGLGLTAIFTPESPTPYYTVAYIAGLSSYAIMVGMYKKTNKLAFFDQDKKNRWDLNLMPQNIFLNKQIATYAMANPGKRINFLPAISATRNF
jgi:hypothetical protein